MAKKSHSIIAFFGIDVQIKMISHRLILTMINCIEAEIWDSSITSYCALVLDKTGWLHLSQPNLKGPLMEEVISFKLLTKVAKLMRNL